MEHLKLFLSNLTLNDYAYIIGAVLIIVLVIVFRESKYVIKLVGDSIVQAEKQLNSEDGQKRLEFAVTQVQQKLPVILKPFVTKYMIVSMIETMLNFMNDAFKLGKTIDIKGNEDE